MVLLLLAAAAGALALVLRQPLIIAFIGVGILAGPSGFGWVRSTDQVHLLAEIGLAMLLFVVGLRLDIGLIRRMGPVALAIGLGQVALTAAVGYGICLTLGMTSWTAIYVAMAVTFSSTIIIVKMLSDKKEADSLHGRITVGLLIVQDILVILAMIGLKAFAGGNQNALGLHAVSIFGKGIALLAGLWIMSYLILPRLLGILARSAELLVLFAIAWALAIAGISEELGFSKEVGAFLAGVSIASTQYRELLASRLISLRDFLLLFFFLDLGSRLNLNLLGGLVWAAIPLSAFVLIGKPIIVILIMGVIGYRKRTSFLSGVTIAQISEFSLILAALGLRLDHIRESDAGLIALVGLITIGISTYMIRHSNLLYGLLAPHLGVIERKIPFREQSSDAWLKADSHDVILFGLGRYGSGIAENLLTRGYKVVCVDFDPQTVKHWNQRGLTAWFGDAEDPEFPAALPLSDTRWVISSLRNRDINMSLIRALQHHGYQGSIAVTTETIEHAALFWQAGADSVFIPFTDAAIQAVDKWKAADEQIRRSKMNKLIAGISNHYIVCGFGRMGQQIVKDFRHQNVPFVVIESNPEQIPKLLDQDLPFVEGKATEDKVLLAAGIERADGLIAVNPSDQENVFIVLTARGLNPNLYIVARSILQDNEDKLRRAGADKVLSPYVLGGHIMAAGALSPRAIEFLDLIVRGDHPDLEVGDFTITGKCPFAGKSIKESGIRQETGVLVLCVKHEKGERTVNPGPDCLIMEGDELIVMGTSEQVDAAERLANGG